MTAIVSAVLTPLAILANGWRFAFAQGERIEKPELPEKVAVFSDNVPNTNSGNYGSRLNSEPGRTMQNLEFQFYSEQRRRKLDSEMVCY